MKYSLQTGANNPILRSISDAVVKIDDEIKELALILRKMMWSNDGVGLASPQIGKNLRVIATTQWAKNKDRKKLLSETLMINPEITEASKETIIFEEACISLPDITGNVKRHKNITVHYMDIKWHKQTKKYKDFNAVIIQHEIDHLDGILFVDKIMKKK